MASYEIKLHPGQMAIWRSPAHYKVVAAGRRFGKSHLATHKARAEVMLKKNAAGFDLEDVSVMYIAPTFDQAKRAVWQKMLRLGGLAKNGGLIVNFNTNEGWIDYVSGRRVYVRGADNPESLRGIGLSYVILDEYADMKPHVWEEIIEPTLLDVEGEALFIGTPKGKNHFYKLFMHALGDAAGDQRYDPLAWSDWEAFHFKSVDNPHISHKRLASVMERSGKSADAIRQELEASFISGGPQILDSSMYRIVDEVPGIVVRREGVGGTKIITDGDRGQTFITVDPAGFTKQGSRVMRNDECVICTTYVNDRGDWYVLDMQHGQWDVREVALRIVRTVQKNRPCRLGIEQGALKNAIDTPLAEYMKEFHIYQMPESLKHGNTKKQDRIMWALQGRLERGKIFLLRGAWNDWLIDQTGDFPSPLAHDDGPDALAYVDQMAQVTYADDDDYGESTFEVLDEMAGY